MPVFSSLPWVFIHVFRTPLRGVAITQKVGTLPAPYCRRLLTPPGVYKRGVTLGVVIGWGNLNGIVASNVYRGGDAPQFYPGHGVMLGYLVVCLFGGSLIQYLLLVVENRKRKQGKRDHWIEGLRPEQLAQRGDERPDFLYTL